jgi:hypothetical protein
MAMMQQMQQPAPEALQEQAGAAQGDMAANMAAMRGEGTATGTESMNGPGEAPLTPPEMMPGNTPEGAAMGAAGPEGALPEEGAAAPAGQPSQMLSQYQIVEGEAQPRIVGQQTIQKEEG